LQKQKRWRTIMKIFSIVLVIFLLLVTSSINSQINVAPLKFGNVWVYGPDPGRVRISIIDTNTVIDSIQYYAVYEDNISSQWVYHMRIKTDDYYAVRLDTSYPAPNHELLYYKKDALLGDTWTVPDPWSQFNAVYIIEDTYIANVFGEQTIVKFLTIDSGILLFYEYWTEKFGQLSRYQNAGGLWLQWVLLGCVIDGVAYGDTSFNPVSVEDEFPLNEFVLSQNFPNPFNPSTSINFTLSEGDFINLEVFNVIGEKVTTLINEFKTAGTYTIQFEADVLASGTYLYVLRTPNFTQTRKMQLVK
jgi:hypothetical protein